MTKNIVGPAEHTTKSGQMAEHLMQMQNARVFIVGDVILDQYISGKVSRISPEAPVPVLLETSQKFVLGGAGNVAANVTSFGASAILAGRIGIDTDGIADETEGEEIGISSRGVTTVGFCIARL